MQSPIANDCLKWYIDGQAGPKLGTQLLLKVLAREIHNSMVGPPEEGRLKEARDAEDNIIISGSTIM